jgi:hypothetical protein
MICFRLSAALCLLLTACGLAHAQVSASQRADDLLARGQKEFAEGRYPDAIETLRAGYVLSPQPRFLYALGQAYRLNHQCKEAVRSYREFVRTEPAKSQLAAAEANIGRCGEEDPSSLEQPPPTSAAAHPQGDNVVVAAAPPPNKPVYKRWWPWTILTVGLVGAGVGLGLGLTLGVHHAAQPFMTTLPEVGPNAH